MSELLATASLTVVAEEAPPITTGDPEAETRVPELLEAPEFEVTTRTSCILLPAN